LFPGVKSVVVEKYLIFYLVFDDRIEVVRVSHGARNLSSFFDDTP
jgi:toxin ParE1/3/4